MISTKNILIIAEKEFKSIFYSPIAYIVMALFLIASGFFFFNTFFLRNLAELRVFFSNMPFILTFTIPAITMRVFADELSTGSYELLATLPVRTEEIVLGKLLSVYYFLLVLLLPTLFYALTVEIVGDLEWGVAIGGYLGCVLLAFSLGVIGVFTSSLTKNQIIALLLGIALCFFLTLVLGNFLIFFPESLVKFFQYLSVSHHFQNISKGLIDFRDIVYFISLILVFAHATVLVMNKKTN